MFNLVSNKLVSGLRYKFLGPSTPVLMLSSFCLGVQALGSSEGSADSRESDEQETQLYYLHLGHSLVNTHSNFPGLRMSWFLQPFKKEAPSCPEGNLKS